MIKILLAASPCTSWSVAQTKNRETKPEGKGWELFKNCVIAKEKFQPDYFLYENNWSASKTIKSQIEKELGAPLMRINSNLVSAQNRDRFYVFNWDIEQPEDRGILLKDILETGEPYLDKSQCLTATYSKQTASEAQFAHSLDKKMRTMVAMRQLGRRINDKGVREDYNPNVPCEQRYEVNKNPDKTNCLTTVTKDNIIAIKIDDKKEEKIYEVKNKQIEVNGKEYPIELEDGCYTIRKLTPIECERLQTMPDGYTDCVSNTQRYKQLGNGWTAEIIIHILNGAFKDISRDEEIIVLSLYDGIATGRYCLDKMGFTNVKYYAYEIDKFAIKVATHNYPDIIEMGDAFDVRKEDWSLK